MMLDLKQYEKLVFTSGKEEGIIEYIFSIIQPESRISLDFGVGPDLACCNSINLVINHNFTGYFIERKDISENIKNEIQNKFPMAEERIKILFRHLTIRNINETIKEFGLPEEIDFLSIDVDGNDLHFLNAIDTLTAKLLMIEYNPSIPKERSISIPYIENFVWPTFHHNYYGASLKALVKIAKIKGYVLIGCESQGANAFFLKKEFVCKDFEEVKLDDVIICKNKNLWEASKYLNWIEI